MPLPNVSIQLQNGALGLVDQTPDRVMGMILNGVGTGVQAYQFMSLDDLYTLVPKTSITPGAEDDEFLRQVEDFYAVAGKGAELWIIGVQAATTTATLFAAGGAAEVLMKASGGRINVIGVSRFELTPTTPTLTDGLPADLIAGIPAAQTFATSMAAQFMPVRVILDGIHVADNPARDLTTYTNNRVGICVASNKIGKKNACIGMLLGRIASIPVNRNIGRVKDGATPAPVGLTLNGTTIENLGSVADTLHNKGYIFLRKFTGKAGYFWNDDHMCTGNTDDYFSLAHGRVIDKAIRISYNTFVEEILDNVLVDQDTGKIVPTTIKYYQNKIERAITLQMGDEISGASAFVDPKQDILATSKIVVELRIVPTSTNRVIQVKLGLFNPNAA